MLGRNFLKLSIEDQAVAVLRIKAALVGLETAIQRETGAVELLYGFTPNDVVSFGDIETLAPTLVEIFDKSTAGPAYNVALFNAEIQSANAGDYPSEFVPSVVWLTSESATTLLEAMGFTVATPAEDNSDTVTNGYIISQAPKAGTPLPENMEIAFVVSIGPEAEA